MTPTRVASRVKSGRHRAVGFGRFRYECLGKAKVQDLDDVVGRELDIGRLEIPMDDASLVGCFHSLSDLHGYLASFFYRNRAASDPLRQSLTRHEMAGRGQAGEWRRAHVISVRKLGSCGM